MARTKSNNISNVETSPDLEPKVLQKHNDIEDAIASRLAEKILDDVDIARLGQSVLKHVLATAKNRFLDWLITDCTSVPMAETYVIEAEQEAA